MPAYGVTIRATFKKTAAQLDREAVDAAETAITGGSYRVAQSSANTQEGIRIWLMNTLNNLFASSHDILFRSGLTTITADVTVNSFSAAIAGTEDHSAGTNGSFSYKVTMERGTVTGEETSFISGIIVATPYSAPVIARIGLKVRDELTVRISNTGNTGTGSLTLSLSGANTDAFVLPTTIVSSLSVGNYEDIVLTKTTGLTAGSYTATLTVSGSGLASRSIQISHTATPVSIEEVNGADKLMAYVQDGIVYVRGLPEGKEWSIYAITGSLVYSGIANSNAERRPLIQRGVYIIATNKGTLKVAY
jgi:hypothetical protein